MRHKLNWRPAPPDGRNFRLADLRKAEPRTVAPVRFLVNPPVKDQEEEGSCGLNAVTTMIEARQGLRDNQYPPVPLSRHYAYYQYRLAYGDVHVDGGVSNYEMMKVLSQTGICREDLWPYLPEYFDRQPSPEADRDAKGHPLGTYYQCEGIEDLIYSIDEGYGVLVGISVHENFPDTIWPGGIIPMPAGKFLGGHDIYACGYDLHARLVQIQNSWGLEWGDDAYPGHAWIPFDYLTPRYSGEFFTVR